MLGLLRFGAHAGVPLDDVTKTGFVNSKDLMSRFIGRYFGLLGKEMSLFAAQLSPCLAACMMKGGEGTRLVAKELVPELLKLTANSWDQDHCRPEKATTTLPKFAPLLQVG